MSRLLRVFVVLSVWVSLSAATTADPLYASPSKPTSTAQDRLFDLLSTSLDMPAGSAWYVQNIKQGIRDATVSSIAIAPNDPSRMYATTYDGYVFSSSDGGESWTEGRLIVRRKSFFGALRPSPIAGGVPFTVAKSMHDLQYFGHLSYDLESSLHFPYGTTGRNFLDISSGAPEFWPVKGRHFLDSATASTTSDSPGGGGAGGDLARLGVGLKTSAVYLAALLRKKKKKPLTMNLQLTLAVKGVEPTGIHMAAVDPADPEHVFAATDMGLFETKDGGMSWILAFPGSSHKERRCKFVGFAPDNPQRVFVATDQGVRISSNRGQTFATLKGTQLSTAPTRWIQWAPSDPNVVYAGTTIGAFRSDDAGITWRWIYYETLPTQNYVNSFAIDPANPDRVVIATGDGLFRTSDGGEKWVRSGGLLFTGVWIVQLAPNPLDGNNIVAVTGRNVWESVDGGETWTALYLNDAEWTFRYATFDPNEDHTLWMVSSNELLRLSKNVPTSAPLSGMAAFRERIEDEPTLSKTIDSALRYFEVQRGQRALKRDGARNDGMIPVLNILGGYMSNTGSADLRLALLDDLSGDGPGDNLWNRYMVEDHAYIFVQLHWNIREAIFHPKEVPYGRLFNDANRMDHKLRSQIQRLYEERRRVMEALLTRPRTDGTTRLYRKMRLDELTAHLNALTNGLFDEAALWAATLD